MNGKQLEAVDNPTISHPVNMSEGLALNTVAPLGTICVQTRNSHYRIFLLDPKTRSALIEGGQFVEPVNAIVNGSVGGSSTFKAGWIGIGMRLEFWTNGRLTSTSPVQSFDVETHVPFESMSEYWR